MNYYVKIEFAKEKMGMLDNYKSICVISSSVLMSTIILAHIFYSEKNEYDSRHALYDEGSRNESYLFALSRLDNVYWARKNYPNLEIIGIDKCEVRHLFGMNMLVLHNWLVGKWFEGPPMNELILGFVNGKKVYINHGSFLVGEKDSIKMRTLNNEAVYIMLEDGYRGGYYLTKDDNFSLNHYDLRVYAIVFHFATLLILAAGSRTSEMVEISLLTLVPLIVKDCSLHFPFSKVTYCGDWIPELTRGAPIGHYVSMGYTIFVIPAVAILKSFRKIISPRKKMLCEATARMSFMMSVVCLNGWFPSMVVTCVNIAFLFNNVFYIIVNFRSLPGAL